MYTFLFLYIYIYIYIYRNEGWPPPKPTEAIIMDLYKKESKLWAKKTIYVPFCFTSTKNVKVVESKKVSHVVQKTFSFLDTRSVICFPMLIRGNFVLKVDQFYS